MKSKFGLAFVWIMALSLSLTAIPTVVCNIRGAIVARLDLPADHPKTFILPSQPQMDLRLANLPYGKYFLMEETYESTRINFSRHPFHFYDATTALMPVEEQCTGDIVVADFNGDGLDDYFTMSGSNLMGSIAQCRIFIKQPGAGFVDETASRLPVFERGGLEAHLIDFQHDGSNDLLLLPYTNGQPNCYLLLNNGEGFFGLAAAPLMPSIAAINAQVVDFNHDGFDDVIFMVMEQNANRLLPQIWINNAGATLVNESATRLPLAQLESFGTWSVNALDLNGDGAEELIMVNNETTPGINDLDVMLTNDGNGCFSLPHVNPLPYLDNGIQYHCLDYDQDGDIDILARVQGFGVGRTLYLLKKAESVMYEDSSEDLIYISKHINGVLISDYDGNGYPDLFLGCVSPGVPDTDILLMNNQGEYSPLNNVIPDVTDFTIEMSFIDANGDAYPDVLMGNTNGEINLTGLSRLYIYNYGTANDDPNTPSNEQLLGQNYPNPFNPSTTISYAVPVAGELSLDIYNLRGQHIKSLASGNVSAGNHRAVWDGTDSLGRAVASGIYTYRLSYADRVYSKKMLLIK